VVKSDHGFSLKREGEKNVADMRYRPLQLAVYLGLALCVGCSPTGPGSKQTNIVAPSPGSNEPDVAKELADLKKSNASRDTAEQAAWSQMAQVVVQYITKPNEFSSALFEYLGLQDISLRKRAFNNLFNLGLSDGALSYVRAGKPAPAPFSVYQDYGDKTYRYESQVFPSLFQNIPRDGKTIAATFDRYKEFLFAEFDEDGLLPVRLTPA
jgi:hypothetical protein